MKICGHFRALSLTSLFIAMLWSLCKLSNVSDDKGCFNSIFCKMGECIMQGRHRLNTEAGGRKELLLKGFLSHEALPLLL